MDWKLLATVFATVFVAELGDKTQFATFLFAAKNAASQWIVFVGAALALIAASALGVVGGVLLADHVSPRTLDLVAGAGFVAIGLWFLYPALIGR